MKRPFNPFAIKDPAKYENNPQKYGLVGVQGNLLPEMPAKVIVRRLSRRSKLAAITLGLVMLASGGRAYATETAPVVPSGAVNNVDYDFSVQDLSTNQGGSPVLYGRFAIKSTSASYTSDTEVLDVRDDSVTYGGQITATIYGDRRIGDSFAGYTYVGANGIAEGPGNGDDVTIASACPLNVCTIADLVAAGIDNPRDILVYKQGSFPGDPESVFSDLKAYAYDGISTYDYSSAVPFAGVGGGTYTNTYESTFNGSTASGTIPPAYFEGVAGGMFDFMAEALQDIADFLLNTVAGGSEEVLIIFGAVLALNIFFMVLAKLSVKFNW